MTARRLLVVAATLGAAVGLAACGIGSAESSERAGKALAPTTTSSTTTTTAPPPPSCGDPRASYPALTPLPDAQSLANDPAIGEILGRERLVVAVDENTEGLASRGSDGQLEGLEIDLARAIARSIFRRGDADSRVKFLTVTTKQKIDYPAQGGADLSISAISMTCERWAKVAFSTEYFTARHAFLVRNDLPVQTAADLAGRRVCMTKGSTSIKTLARLKLEPPPRQHLVDSRIDCLVALQEGEADAYYGHDSFLIGMVGQDPGLRIVPEGEKQHYGIALGPKDVTLARYVNGVLAEMRDDGSLAALYEEWLGPRYAAAFQELPEVPAPDHTRALP